MKLRRKNHYFFAGGGTGGHIYPAVAIAAEIRKADPDSHITFFCGQRPVDTQILSKVSFRCVPLPGRGFYLSFDRLVASCISLWKGYRIARKTVSDAGCGGRRRGAVVIGTGGFVSVGAVYAAHKLNLPVALVNVDSIPGKANKLLASVAREVFLQFDDAEQHFKKNQTNVHITGCPLRAQFANSNPARAVSDLNLDSSKKTLVITGASSGSTNINDTAAKITGRLDEFADTWQIVHLTGSRANLRRQESICPPCKIHYEIVDYYDEIANLYAAADLVVGRAGGVSIAEYAAMQLPAICVPYPYHRDKHQYQNAKKLVDAGCAVIAEDAGRNTEKTAQTVLAHLHLLMKDDDKLAQMRAACKNIATMDAAKKIAARIVSIMPKHME